MSAGVFLSPNFRLRLPRNLPKCYELGVSKPTKKVIFAVGSLALFANAIFVVVATAFNLFIAVPVILTHYTSRMCWLN
jgi:hypothetical protein